MGLERVAPVQVGTHAGDHAHVALLCSSHALAEEVAAIEEFSMAMKLDLRGIEREDAGHADKDDVRAGGMPVVGPLFDVHHRGVVLGHVALSDAANLLLPRLGAQINRQPDVSEVDELLRARYRWRNCFRGKRRSWIEKLIAAITAATVFEEGAAIEHPTSPIFLQEKFK